MEDHPNIALTNPSPTKLKLCEIILSHSFISAIGKRSHSQSPAVKPQEIFPKQMTSNKNRQSNSGMPKMFQNSNGKKNVSGTE